MAVAILSGVTLRVQIAPGVDRSDPVDDWPWVDITDDVRVDDGITISAGRPDESGQVDPGTCSLALDNSTGDYSRTNPLGAYYPDLAKNTPLRVQIDLGSGYVTRFIGDVVGWPPRWDKSGNLATAYVTAAGIIRRLAQRDKPLQSALYRAVVASNPLYYWPLEDVSGAVQATPVAGGIPLTGPAKFGTADPPGGSQPVLQTDYDPRNDPIPDLSTHLEATLTATTPTMTTWRIEAIVQFPGVWTVDDIAPVFCLEWTTLGTATDWGLYFSDVDQTWTIDATVSGTRTTITTTTLAQDGEWHHVRLDGSVSGGNTNYELFIDGVSIVSGSLTGGTSTVPNTIGVGINFEDTNRDHRPAIGHVAIWSSHPTTDTVDAWTGWAGETAADRIERLCTENGVPITIVGTAAESQAMGAQPADSLLALLRECEETDGGVLYEDSAGLAYQVHAARRNAVVTLELDADAGDLAEAPEPADDDQRLVNDVTASRSNGGSVRYEATGDYSPDGPVGRYDEEITINPETDADLQFHAEWRVHLGTVDDLRWPMLDLNLAHSSGLRADWLTCAVGSRITVDNPPSVASSTSLDLFIEGFAEVLSWRVWRVALNCSPARPWITAVVDGAGTAVEPVWRLTSATSTLASGISSSATSLSVATASAPLWTTTEVPFDIEVGGEQLTVSAISGASSPQTFTISARAVNGITKSHLSGATVKLWRPAVLARN